MIFSENFSMTLPVSGIEYVISVLGVYLCGVYMLRKPKGEQSHKTLEPRNLIAHVYITYTCWCVHGCMWHVSHILFFFFFFLLDSSVSTKAQVIAVK